MLFVFKAARRQEYLQQNLRVLGAQRGETVETAYGLRWQSPSVRRRLPEPGEEALIVFTSRPYRRYTPARFARVVRAWREDDVLRLVLELGSRARSPDRGAWQAYTASGPNPSESSEVWILRTEDDHPAAAGDVPVTYAEPADDDRAWRDAIAELADDDDYRAAVFLRVGSVRAADDPAAPQLEPPYRLGVERAYVVRLASLNPHLSAESLQDARVIPVRDELATAVVVDPQPVPADGGLDVLISPIVAGPGWLELDVALGTDAVAAASLGWVAEGAAPPAAAPEAALAGALELPFGTSDPIADAAVRAYAVAEEAGMTPQLRLRLISELRAIAPEEPRLAEADGLARYDVGEHDTARATLAALPADSLTPRGRATFVAAILRGGRLPEPIERVRLAGVWRPESARLVLDASEALDPADQLRLAEFAAGELLSEERASDWYTTISQRELGAIVLGRLLERWGSIDPERAAATRVALTRAGRLAAT